MSIKLPYANYTPNPLLRRQDSWVLSIITPDGGARAT